MSNSSQTPGTKDTQKVKRVLSWPLLIVVGALILGAIGTYVVLQRIGSTEQGVDKAGYQVVYTTSGQLFFGKLQNTDGAYVTLKSPYTAQSVATTADAQSATDDATTLLKISSQLYGPDDSMSIRAEQVVFWQNLRDDSKVVQAIKAKE